MYGGSSSGAANDAAEPAAIHFGTDGWRARFDGDFTRENLARVAEATARTFIAHNPNVTRPTVMVGYDTREDADAYAALAAEVMAVCGLRVLLSDAWVPTPALCWSIARDPHAIGGVMLTASHNPAGWLGFKLRLADGGAAGVDFSNEVEAALPEKATMARSAYDTVDMIGPYLDNLRGLVDEESIGAVAPRLVVDPLYGAARSYLAGLLRQTGAEVVEIHGERDPQFGGLHPEPIPPWTDEAASQVRMLGAVAALVTDGDGDRIGAIDEDGTFVSPSKILVLVAQHLVRTQGETGRIVKTFAASNLIDRAAAALRCPFTVTPIGFKWIYAEMLAGDVLCGGEESGGLGVTAHLRERDGLLIALLLTDMMATQHKSLKQLVSDMEEELGHLYYSRRDLRLALDHIDRVRASLPTLNPATLAGRAVIDIDRLDGAKLLFANDEWLLLRASGTEPLLRVYAEAATPKGVDELLDAGQALIDTLK
jgi:phosphomannomutase